MAATVDPCFSQSLLDTHTTTENWGPDVIVPRWETLVQWDCLELLQRLSLRNHLDALGVFL